jgi:hypothetical protein
MKEKIEDCITRLKEKYPQNSICIGVNFWHFNHSGNDEIKYSLYMETGKNMEFNNLEALIIAIDFILSLPDAEGIANG